MDGQEVLAPRSLAPGSTLDWTAREIVTTGGDIAIVGLASGTMSVGFGVVPFETRVVVPFWGTRAELAEVIALARTGRIRAHVDRFALTDANTAYEKLRAGQLKGRAVIMPGGYASGSPRHRA